MFYTDVVNEVGVTEGVLNIFVTDAAAMDGAVLAQAGGMAGVEVCLYDATNVLVECKETDADGFVEFADVPEGDYEMTVQTDGLIVVAVDGGEQTVSNANVVDDGLSTTPASVTFSYSPTLDLAQDGWLDDVDGDTVIGSVGLTIFVDESDAQLIEKTVQVNGTNVGAGGATVTIFHDAAATQPVLDDQNNPISVDTDADGVASIVVEPGTYTICSTVDVDVDGTNIFPYTICDPDYVVEETHEVYDDLINNHVTGELTKVVEVRECEAIEGVDYCIEYEAAVGVAVTVNIDGTNYGPFQTDANGEVTVTVPDDDDVLVGVCSDVNEDEICDDTDTNIVFVEGSATVTNQHSVSGFILGQIDVTMHSEESNTDLFEVCLYDDASNTEVDCVEFVPADIDPTVNGFFFDGVPVGVYYMVATNTTNNDTFTSPAYVYSVVKDGFSRPLADIAESIPGSDVGDLEPDGKWDWLITNLDGSQSSPGPFVAIPGTGQYFVGQLDVGWSEFYVSGDFTHPSGDATWCLYDNSFQTPSTGALFETNAVQCVDVSANALGVGDGIYFTDVPSGTYYVALSFDGGTNVERTQNALAYSPVTDQQNDTLFADIVGAGGYGALDPQGTFDFVHVEPANSVEPELAYGYTQ